MKHISESIIGRRGVDYSYWPSTKEELLEIINNLIEQYGPNCNLNIIDTSHITDMSDLFAVEDNRSYNGLFSDKGMFNGDISRWDVRNVRNMSGMFTNSNFNGYIGDWDVRNVRNMESMFNNARSFNQNISRWNVRNVRNMDYMFCSATSFNQNISNWNVKNVQKHNNVFLFDPLDKQKYKHKQPRFN